MATDYRNQSGYSSGNRDGHGPSSTLGDDHAEQLAGAVVSKDGDVLGGLFKLPKPLRIMFQLFLPDVKEKISKIGGAQVTKLVEAGAEALHVPAAEAQKIAKGAGLATAYIVPYIDNIGDLNKTRKIHDENKKALLADLAPLLVANRTCEKKGITGGRWSSGYEGNRMIERAMQAVNSITYHNLATDATNAISNATVNYTTHIENKLAAAKTATDGKAVAHLEKTLTNLDNWGRKAGGAVQMGAQEYAQSGELKETIGKLSFGGVLEIRDYLHSNELDGVKKSGENDYHVDEVARMVESTFKQFQQEGGNRPLPSQRLHDVSTKLAKQLVDGDMSYLSLFNIIGKGELLNDKQNGFVGNEKIEHILRKETGMLNKSTTLDVDDFLSKNNYTSDDLKGRLQTKDVDERALVVMLNPEPVLLKAGMKKEEIDQLRSHGAERVVEKMIVPMIASLSAIPEEELRKKGYDDEDLALLRNLENAEAVKNAMSGRDHGEGMKGVLRKGIMGQDSAYWQELIQKGKGETVTKSDAGGLTDAPKGPLEHAQRETTTEQAHLS
jgi:hypothetical protein